MDANILKINESIYNNNYKVCFIEPYKSDETIIYGKIQNFNPSNNIVVFVEEKSNLYIIPYTSIKWMIPNGLSRQYKEKISLNDKIEITKEEQKINCENERLIRRVKEAIINQLNINEEDVTLNASLIEDLGADSLDLIELCMALEEEFDIEISDDDAKYVKTVFDTIELVKKYVN